MSNTLFKIKPKNFKPSISLFLLTTVVILSYLSLISIHIKNSLGVSITTPMFSVQMILAHVLLVAVWGFFFFSDKFWKTAYTIYLILALTPLLELMDFSLFFSIGSLSIDLVAFFFLLLHIGLNPEVIRNFSKLVKGPDAKNNQSNPKRISKLEQRFETKTKAQLQSISTSTDFSPEAQQAAKNVLEKKQNS